MINLYNLLETPYCQFYVYMKVLTLAVDGKVTEYIIPSFKKIDSFLKDWTIGIPEQRELFLALSNILKENKRYSCNEFLLSSILCVFSLSLFGVGVLLKFLLVSSTVLPLDSNLLSIFQSPFFNINN